MDDDRVFHPFGDMGVREAESKREEISQWLMDTGLLWAVNKFFFHPLGVALTVEARAQEPPTPEEEVGMGFMWLWPSGDGWKFEEETDKAGREKFMAYIESINYNDKLRLLTNAPSLMSAAVLARNARNPEEVFTDDAGGS